MKIVEDVEYMKPGLDKVQQRVQRTTLGNQYWVFRAVAASRDMRDLLDKVENMCRADWKALYPKRPQMKAWLETQKRLAMLRGFIARSFKLSNSSQAVVEKALGPKYGSVDALTTLCGAKLLKNAKKNDATLRDVFPTSAYNTIVRNYEQRQKELARSGAAT
eukprot:gb/GEZN01002917.1/.p1 GENE.gb/GEZN01002917.1/~~gb/GEZN01002917.1/.p1  ORF type:complete len:162 (-),score=29.66 gb/GEZN01002917.1/:922-1407(-)